jgi:hypothetical protein
MTGETGNTEAQVDLRAMLRDIGGLPPGGAISSVDLRDHDGTVEMLEESSRKVVSKPSLISGWVDGVQASRPVTWVNQRPVQLAWVAAGAASTEGKPAVAHRKLWLGCAAEDRAFAQSIAHGADVETESTCDPLELSKALTAQVGAQREILERRAVSDLIKNSDGLVVADGPIVARSQDQRVVGVVKSHATRYLADHTSLYKLPSGWRSAAFKVSARGLERFSSYVRLHDATSRWWDFGLLRLETFDPEILDGLAAAVLKERQYQGSRDGRWDRHLATVRWVEDWLRSGRPPIFG